MAEAHRHAAFDPVSVIGTVILFLACAEEPHAEEPLTARASYLAAIDDRDSERPGSNPRGSGGDEARDSVTAPSASGSSGAEAAAYFPLVDGATYTYGYREDDGLHLAFEAVHSCASVPERCAAWAGYDPSLEGFWMGRTGSSGKGEVVVRLGAEILRVHKWEDGVQEIDYEPGFPRWDDAWLGAATDELFSYPYVRTLFQDDGIGPGEERAQVFSIVSLHETISVPAGTFDCMKVRRNLVVGDAITDGGARTKLLWFARGIGKIRELHLDGINAGQVEELQSCSLCPTQRREWTRFAATE